MALPDDREFRPTTANDVHELFGCWTRLEVLIALSGRPRPIGIVSHALGLRRPHIHFHTSTLERQGLIRSERIGKAIQFSLSHHIAIRLIRADGPSTPAESRPNAASHPSPRRARSAASSVEIVATADDGARLSLFIPHGSPAMRLLAAGLWARDHDEPELITAVRTRAPVLLPTPRGG